MLHKSVARIIDAGEHIVDLTDSIAAMVQAIETPNPVRKSVALDPVLETAVDRLETRYDNLGFEWDPTPEVDVQVLSDQFLGIVIRATVHTLVECSGVSQQQIVLRPFRTETKSDGCFESESRSRSRSESESQSRPESDPEGDQRIANTDGKSDDRKGGNETSAGFDLVAPTLEKAEVKATVDELNQGSDIESILVQTFLDRYGGEVRVICPENDGEEPVLRVELDAAE
ncbi:response regulator receiver protein [Natrialba chahannaoensis JCM 10990]|uniref:Response regulator receiver protein n=1 Tax=Natrialba chahannaoensis JCM 10990 TaxID=1227492 RepID=M0B846_9EURY|nr:hypothetical protein [Natrialba chahannaoensis]ELZ06453.1 response regulator receiver protein [Natrialba chahannaoensis JCM 10990]